MRWYVAQTHQQAETLALRELGKQGFVAWLPTEVHRREKRHRGMVLRDKAGRPQIVEVVRPFFTGYLFVQFDAERPGWGPIMSTTGVRRLFCSSVGRPAPVRHGVVEALQARGRPGDGAIDSAYAGPSFPNGAQIVVTDGPFADWPGVVSMTHNDRIHVLLSMLGRDVPVDLSRDQVRAATQA